MHAEIWVIVKSQNEWTIVSSEQIASLAGKVMLHNGCLLAQLKRETGATLPLIP